MSTPDHVDQVIAAWRRERPDLDPSPIALIGRLHRLAAVLTRELVAVYAEFGLGEGEFDVLATLRRSGAPYELAPGVLGASTMITSGTVTKRVDRLEAAGLVTRRVDERDGRARAVRLTTEGRRVIDAAVTAHLANERRLVAGLSGAQRTDLVRLLRAWGSALEELG